MCPKKTNCQGSILCLDLLDQRDHRDLFFGLAKLISEKSDNFRTLYVDSSSPVKIRLVAVRSPRPQVNSIKQEKMSIYNRIFYLIYNV